MVSRISSDRGKKYILYGAVCSICAMSISQKELLNVQMPHVLWGNVSRALVPLQQ
jgi:hypothetical protein